MAVSIGVNAWVWNSPFTTDNEGLALIDKAKQMGFDSFEFGLEDVSHLGRVRYQRPHLQHAHRLEPELLVQAARRLVLLDHLERHVSRRLREHRFHERPPDAAAALVGDDSEPADPRAISAEGEHREADRLVAAERDA